MPSLTRNLILSMQTLEESHVQSLLCTLVDSAAGDTTAGRPASALGRVLIKSITHYSRPSTPAKLSPHIQAHTHDLMQAQPQVPAAENSQLRERKAAKRTRTGKDDTYERQEKGDIEPQIEPLIEPQIEPQIEELRQVKTRELAAVRLAAEWRAELVSQSNELLRRLPSSEAATLLCSIRDNDSVLSDHLVALFATDDDALQDTERESCAQ